MVDFEITVVAAEDDEANGIIGARGAKGGLPEEHDFAHVRNWLKGQLATLEGTMPIGWSLDVVIHSETGDQRAFVGNVQRVPRNVEVPVDRLDKIETGVCVSSLPDNVDRGAWQTVTDLVDEQAEDEGLWGVKLDGSLPITEAYLQQELRRLHEAVEVAGGACGLPIANQGDGVWYHLQPCANPDPGDTEGDDA